MSEPIKAAWRKYQREVIPKNAPFVQHEECRRAFYAGVAALFGIMLEASADDKSEAQGAIVLDQVQEELKAYASAMEQLEQEQRCR